MTLVSIYTRDKCHLVSNWETAALPPFVVTISIPAPCGSYRLCVLVGRRIGRSIAATEQNTKLPPTMSTKRRLSTVARAVWTTFFLPPFPVATKKKIFKPLNLTTAVFCFQDNLPDLNILLLSEAAKHQLGHIKSITAVSDVIVVSKKN